MNFYKRFIGDIQAKTGNLSLAEFGAYDRLLDHYYSTEQPVPTDLDECYRICRAMSKDERRAVDKVIGLFFKLTPEGYVQDKAEEQIAKALPLIEAARANGKKGGRPKKPETHNEPSGLTGDQGKEQKRGKKEAKNSEKSDCAQSVGKTSADLCESNENNGLEDSQKPAGFLNGTQHEPSAKATQSQSQITELRSVDISAFEVAWKAYPRRPGASRVDSLKAWTARVRGGADPAVILAGVQRYATHCAAVGTEPNFIKQPATFFGPGEHYLSDWTAPPPSHSARATAETAYQRSQRELVEQATGGLVSRKNPAINEEIIDDRTTPIALGR